MSFMVKLIDVVETKDEAAREDLQGNCTHVCNNFWLFEGDEEALDSGIEFNIVGEQILEGYGDMTGSRLKAILKDTYGVDKCFVD